ncbi:MAG: hypothetical protein IPN09_02305 [Bacteroidetes bacterium]|nr:hypothetical protein [Bacteroidota bacterium]
MMRKHLKNKNYFQNKILMFFPGSGLDTNYYSPDFCNAQKSATIKILMVSRLLIDKGILEYVEVAKI